MAYTLARLCFGISAFTLAQAQTSLARDQASARTVSSSTTQYPGMRESQKAPSYASLWDGAYVGVTAGYNLNGVKTNGNANGEYNGGAIPATVKSNVVAHGFEGGVFAGYGKIFNSDVFTAVELSGDLGSINGKLSKSSAAPGNLTQTLSVRMQKKESFGGAVRVGKLINGMLPYAKVGVIATRWRMNFAHHLDDVSRQKTRNKFLPGVQAGVGAEIPVSERMRVRAEYALAVYPSMQTKLAFSNAIATYNANAKIRPVSHTLKLGIAMPFRYN